MQRKGQRIKVHVSRLGFSCNDWVVSWF